MLDRVDPGEDGAAHALGGRGMGGGDAAGAVRDLDRAAHLLDGEGGVGGLARAPAIIGIELHHVGAAADLMTRRDRDPGTVRLLRAERGESRVGELRAIGAGRDDRAGRDQHARPRHDAARDRVAQPDVGIARALGAEIAHGGEARHQSGARGGDGARGAQRQRLAQHLIVPARFVIGMEEEVRMALDHPRHQGRARQVHDAGPGRRGKVRPRRLDPVAAHQHLPALVRRGIHPVEDPRRAKQDERFGPRLRGGLRREQQRKQDQEPAPAEHVLSPPRWRGR
jgi:hypothetical protein